MVTPLLATKLYIPPLRRDSVPRPRLRERLNEGLHHRLVLVSAPAGFGKTTLLSECAALCRHSLSWLSVDERDHEPTRFWTYVLAALQTLYGEIGTTVLEALQVPRALPDEILLSQLINQIAGIPEPFTLMVDDLHVITNPQIHEQLIFFVEHAPAQIHLVVSSRADPPWPLARWRARGQVVEMRMDDLRFTAVETAAFLNDAMELDLSPEDVAALDARTEGWIAGLQLAALALQGTQPTKGRNSKSFVRRFSGSHRFILDYLLEEVLNRQPPGIQEFLLQTSILERLTAPLCNAVRFGDAETPSSSSGTAVRLGTAQAPSSQETTAVTRREDSQAILERLEQANLFLVPLDDERRWYRYHRLFADLLRSRLEQEHGEQVSMLHRRASAWCEGQGLLSEAVGYALAAGDVEGVARMARQNALAVMDQGELTALAKSIEALPGEAVNAHPWLCIAHAWVLVFAGLLEAAELRLRSAESAVETSRDAQRAEEPVLSAAEGRHLAGHIAAIRGYVAALRGDMSGAVELSREALEQLPDKDLAVRALAADLLGSVLRWSGELAAAEQVLGQAITITQAAGDSLMAVEALCALASVHLAQGQLHKTVATCRDALRVADEHVTRGGRQLPVAATAHNVMSEVLREWNDLDGALRRATEGVELSEQWGWPEGLALGYRRQARTRQALGDSEGAHRAIQKARQAASSLSPWFGAHMAAHEARLWLAQGNLAPAAHWAQESGLGADDEPSYQSMDEHSALARLLIAQGKLDEASRLLMRLVEMAELARAMGYVIESLVLRALTLQAQGKEDQALADLERALALGESEGYVRTFVDEGPQMGRLLRRAVVQGISVDYAGKLLAALEEEATAGATSSAISRRARPPLVESLSPRETEVLRLLTTHLSHAEMAEELVVSVNTVRSHVKNIYGKLGVHSRMEAVERARELGLLD
ncbi:MAG: LuxR C-terminal-related transcriptional regulator [Anaerolineae bacterium]